ncbi:MAG: hypothetical protein LUE11_09945 [Clostridia bacterium]|nr:hypothetical protein [Clostridia bacterium]
MRTKKDFPSVKRSKNNNLIIANGQIGVNLEHQINIFEKYRLCSGAGEKKRIFAGGMTGKQSVKRGIITI